MHANGVEEAACEAIDACGRRLSLIVPCNASPPCNERRRGPTSNALETWNLLFLNLPVDDVRRLPALGVWFPRNVFVIVGFSCSICHFACC